MTLSKQLINVLGIVLVVAILIAGMTLVALPLFGQSQATDAAVRNVSQTNSVYEMEVEQLTIDKEGLPALTASVETLRTEIAELPQLDDVHELVISSAAESAAVVVSVVASSPVAWEPRTVIAALPGEATADAAPADSAPADAESTDGTAADTQPADETTASSSAGAITADDLAAGTPSPQQQVPVTITVEVADATQAAAFLDGLRAGPRLIGIETAMLTDEESNLQLIVTALAFIRTGD